jgi:hypothetical protein
VIEEEASTGGHSVRSDKATISAFSEPDRTGRSLQGEGSEVRSRLDDVLARLTPPVDVAWIRDPEP